jgi:6-pyruvoyltetrahydropterin/6-carboxytetrahydropterin synthase
MRVSLTKTIDFESAHWLPSFPEGHKCRRLHGHSFKVDVVVEGEVDPAKGYLIDFGDIKRVLDPLKDELDHRLLNDIAGLENPTAELLAKWVYERAKPALPLVVAVRVRETCTSAAEYRGE